MSNNKIIPYSLCVKVLLAVLILQYAVSVFINKLGNVFYTLPISYTYILLTQVFAIFVPLLAVCIYKKVNIKRVLRLYSVKGKTALMCAMLGFCLQPVAILLNIPLQRLAESSSSVVPPPADLGDAGFMIIFVCLIPALFEEFLIRGMLLTAVRRNGYLFTIIITTFLFVLLHGNVYSCMGHIALGLCCAFVVLNTNSVFSGVLLHFFFNFSGVVIDYLTYNFYMWGNFLGSFGFFVFIGIAGLILSIILLCKINNNKIKKYPSDNFVFNLCKGVFNIPVAAIIIIGVLLWLF